MPYLCDVSVSRGRYLAVKRETKLIPVYLTNSV